MLGPHHHGGDAAGCGKRSPIFSMFTESPCAITLFGITHVQRCSNVSAPEQVGELARRDQERRKDDVVGVEDPGQAADGVSRNDFWMLGNAMFTIVESRKARKAPKAATNSTAIDVGCRRTVSGPTRRRRPERVPLAGVAASVCPSVSLGLRSA
jgi:hypothetical protein